MLDHRTFFRSGPVWSLGLLGSGSGQCTCENENELKRKRAKTKTSENESEVDPYGVYKDIGID